MTEHEILEKIKNSAGNIEIPESIKPEAMKEKLEETNRQRQAKRVKNRKIGAITAAAACLMIVYTAHVFVFSSDGRRQADSYTEAAADMSSSDSAGQEQGDGAATGGEQSAAETTAVQGADGETSAEASAVQKTEGDTSQAAPPKQDAGDVYTVAKDYGEVYDMLKKYEEQLTREKEYLNDIAGTDGATASGSADFSTSIKYDAMESIEDLAVPEQETAEESYSTTNLQTAGVDESDIVKNDGKYIYTVKDGRVNIVDITGETMKVAGTIELQYQTAADKIVEMYVDGDAVNLIVERKKAHLSKKESGEEVYEATPQALEEDTIYLTNGSGFLPLGETEEAVEDYDVFFTETNTLTEVHTYDITNRSEPKLLGSVEQQGYYKTSRKIGDIVYLFTTTSVPQPQMRKSAAIKDESVGGWIPLVNGEPVAADCIYLPREEGDQGLLISSVNVNQPENIVDHTLILNNYMNTYVSTEALYLYYESYETSESNTMIAKFSLNDGYINAVDAASVKGSIYDTFAINENNGKLRVLTTDWSNGENSNALYLLDEKMKLTGKLEGIAKGEEIYAARYLGNTAYFVTYRNTDPLFAVDLTDESNPVILSELKITGFSEYLHFWGEDKLLGIGYETDPDSGRREGIKISMFDISNPSKLTTINSCVIAEADYSPALYNYKCVLVDAKENLIGLAMENYENAYQNYYTLFQWQGGKFAQIMTESLGENVNLENYRGIYIGNQFFIAAPEEIISFDRENDYRMKEKITL